MSLKLGKFAWERANRDSHDVVPLAYVYDDGTLDADLTVKRP